MFIIITINFLIVIIIIFSINIIVTIIKIKIIILLLVIIIRENGFSDERIQQSNDLILKIHSLVSGGRACALEWAGSHIQRKECLYPG